MSELFHPDMNADELEPIAMAVHNLVDQFPLVMRSRNRKGIRIEGSYVIDRDFSGPMLDKAIETNELVREIPGSGAYKGIPTICSPIRNSEGECVGAIGVIDLRHAYAEMKMKE